MSNNPLLEKLSCTNNELISLNLTANTVLQSLDLMNNPLSTVVLPTSLKDNPDLDLPDNINDIRRVLNRILPDVIKFDAKKNDNIFFESNKLGKYAAAENLYIDNIPTIRFESSTLAIGKFLGDYTIAIIYCNGSEIVEFYRLDNQQWKKIGAGQTKVSPYYISFEKLIDQAEPVIVLSSSPNMNGNSWKEAYIHEHENDRIEFAGSFCTSYEVNLADSTITEEYYGSWYMAPHKMLYKWSSNKLIPMRYVSLQLIETTPDNHYQEIIYRENLTGKSDGLKLIFKERYDEDKAEHQKYWDDFFGVNEVVTANSKN